MLIYEYRVFYEGEFEGFVDGVGFRCSDAFEDALLCRLRRRISPSLNAKERFCNVGCVQHPHFTLVLLKKISIFEALAVQILDLNGDHDAALRCSFERASVAAGRWLWRSGCSPECEGGADVRQLERDEAACEEFTWREAGGVIVVSEGERGGGRECGGGVERGAG